MEVAFDHVVWAPRTGGALFFYLFISEREVHSIMLHGHVADEFLHSGLYWIMGRGCRGCLTG